MRLTAEDGYSAQRSYSIASAPGMDRLELTVVRFDDGEVSPYLTDVAEVGDQFELRGPVGGWFVWDGDDSTPVLLAGGGSGVVPLMAMMRHHALVGSTAAMHLVYSARTHDDVLYRDELSALADGGHRAVTVTLTREESPAWTGDRGRVDAVPARRGGVAAGRAAALLRLRTDSVRRGGQRRPGRSRPRAEPGEDRRFGPTGE